MVGAWVSAVQAQVEREAAFVMGNAERVSGAAGAAWGDAAGAAGWVREAQGLASKSEALLRDAVQAVMSDERVAAAAAAGRGVWEGDEADALRARLEGVGAELGGSPFGEALRGLAGVLPDGWAASAADRPLTAALLVLAGCVALLSALSAPGEDDLAGVMGGDDPYGAMRPSVAMPTPPQMARAGQAIRNPPPEYEPGAIAESFRGRRREVVMRVADIVREFSVFALAVLSDKATGSVEANERRRAAELSAVLSRLGTTFMKVGQALSTRPDICPPVYLEEFSSLQDDLPTFPDSLAYRFIEDQLGKPVSDLFEEISPRPIAAASLGQVYKARLKGSGEEVAVKVQRPGVARNIDLDFYLIRSVCVLIDENVDFVNTSAVALVDNFACRVAAELNYVQEALNTERFAELYAAGRPEILVPDVYWTHTNSRVLTTSWVDGIKLSNTEAIAATGQDPLKFIDYGIECTLRQLLEFGYFHGDPHPGNLLATRDGRLAFLDFGIMSETPVTARYAIIEHVVHLVNRDYDAMARDYYTLDFLDRSVDVRPIVPALREFFDDVLEASVEQLNFKTLTDGLGDLFYKFPFDVPAYYALILRSLTLLEGLALSTDKDYKVIAKAYPYIASRLLTDPAPELRESLSEVLFKDGEFRWNRLENLLKEGGKNGDFSSGAALTPLVEFALKDAGPGGGNAVRDLVENETVNVAESLAYGAFIDAIGEVRNVAESAGVQLPREWGPEHFLAQEADLLSRRERFMSAWGLLSSGKDFDAQRTVEPVIEVLQLPEAQQSALRIGQAVGLRLTARALWIAMQAIPVAADAAAGAAAGAAAMRPSPAPTMSATSRPKPGPDTKDPWDTFFGE